MGLTRKLIDEIYPSVVPADTVTANVVPSSTIHAVSVLIPSPS